MIARRSQRIAKLIAHQDPQDRLALPAPPPTPAGTPSRDHTKASPGGERPKDEDEDEEIHSIALWRVSGEEGNDSGGGDTFFYVLTDGPFNLPDCSEAHRSFAKFGHSLDNVRRVEKVVDHFTQDDDDADGCVNQTGRPVPDDVAALIASLMRSLEYAQEEMGKAIRERDRSRARFADELTLC